MLHTAPQMPHNSRQLQKAFFFFLLFKDRENINLGLGGERIGEELVEEHENDKIYQVKY